MDYDGILAKLKKMAREYSLMDEGQWLLDFEWDAVPVSMRKLPPDICGMQFFGVIYLIPCCEPLALFSTYIHELRHVWQRKMHPLQYYVGKIYRPLIENDAKAQEFSAENWILNYKE